MKENLHLNLLYNFIETRASSGVVESYYKILYFFSQTGPVSQQTLSDIYEANFEKNSAIQTSNTNLIFTSLDQLGNYAVDVCRNLGVDEVFILSVHDYNIGLDSCLDIESFQGLFKRYGTCISQPENYTKKKNLLNKFF